MAQLADRTAKEQRLAAAIAAAFAEQHAKAVQTGSIDWERFNADIKQAAIDNLQPIFLATGGGVNRFAPEGVLLGASARWADQYGQQLADEVTRNTQAKVREAVANSMGDDARLADNLRGVFSDQRAMGIAVTEITRTASQGEQFAAAIWPVAQEKKPTAIWRAEPDVKVCEVCGDYDGTSATVWGAEFPDGPPGHPNCRCYLDWV